MTYDFQRRVHRTGDIVDGELLTDDFAVPAERVAGRLRAHQIKAGAARANRIQAEPDAFHEFDWAYQWVSGGFGNFDSGGPAHGAPPAGRSGHNGSAFIIPNHFAWETLHEFTEVTTGTEAWNFDVLLNHLWAGFNAAGTEPKHAFACIDQQGTAPVFRSSRAPSIQFGIRLDGRLIYTTGVDNDYNQPHQGIKAAQEMQATASGFTMAPGFISVKSRRTNGPGRTIMATHMVAMAFVSPGTHRGSVVVRRIPRIDSQRLVNNDTVAINTRTFLLHRMKIKPVPTRAVVSVTTADFKQGLPLTTAALDTDSVQTIKAAVNAAASEHLDAAALRCTQVQGPLALTTDNTEWASAYAEMVSTGSITVTSFAPGESGGVPFVNASTAPGTEEWVKVRNSANTNNLIVAPSSGNFPVGAAYLTKLFGRILIKRIKKQGSAEIANCGDFQHLGIVGIYYTTSAGTFMLQNSIVPVARSPTFSQASNETEEVGGTANDWVDVPLFGIVDEDLPNHGSGVTEFGIAVSGMNYVSLSAVEVIYTRANLSAITFNI